MIKTKEGMDNKCKTLKDTLKMQNSGQTWKYKNLKDKSGSRPNPNISGARHPTFCNQEATDPLHWPAMALSGPGWFQQTPVLYSALQRK